MTENVEAATGATTGLRMREGMKLDDYRREWDDYSSKISELFSEEEFEDEQR